MQKDIRSGRLNAIWRAAGLFGWLLVTGSTGTLEAAQRESSPGSAKTVTSIIASNHSNSHVDGETLDEASFISQTEQEDVSEANSDADPLLAYCRADPSNTLYMDCSCLTERGRVSEARLAILRDNKTKSERYYDPDGPAIMALNVSRKLLTMESSAEQRALIERTIKKKMILDDYESFRKLFNIDLFIQSNAQQQAYIKEFINKTIKEIEEGREKAIRSTKDPSLIDNQTLIGRLWRTHVSECISDGVRQRVMRSCMINAPRSVNPPDDPKVYCNCVADEVVSKWIAATKDGRFTGTSWQINTEVEANFACRG